MKKPVSLIPTTLDPRKAKILNNQSPHFIVTPTFWCASNLMTFLLMLLVALGYFFMFESNKLMDFEFEYGDACFESKAALPASNKFRNATTWNCTVDFTPPTDLIQPKVYYRLDNFFHNHRSFVKSRSYQQLNGDEMSDSVLKTKCDPNIYNTNLTADGWWIPAQLPSIKEKDMEVAYPCGSMAKYIFTDKFLEVYKKGAINEFRQPVLDSGIATTTDVKDKFHNSTKNATSWAPINEHLMVWFQQELHSDFIKLYGSVNGTLKAGQTYRMVIQETFNSKRIGTKKYVYFSEVGIFGGKNLWIAYIFMATAGVIGLLLVVFFVLFFLKVYKKNRDTETYISTLKF